MSVPAIFPRVALKNATNLGSTNPKLLFVCLKKVEKHYMVNLEFIENSFFYLANKLFNA